MQNSARERKSERKREDKGEKHWSEDKERAIKREGCSQEYKMSFEMLYSYARF